jgi:hypothetical protein
MPEHVGMEEALELLKKPRTGNVVLAFKRAKYMPEVNHEGPYAKKKKEEKEHEGKISKQFKLTGYSSILSQAEIRRQRRWRARQGRSIELEGGVKHKNCYWTPPEQLLRTC